MKYILLTILLGFISNSNAADFKCTYTKGWDRPSNDNAIKLAAALKVKTCNSSKFINYVKSGKHTMNTNTRNSNGTVKALKFN